MAQEEKTSRYDRLYASGGFGYESQRAYWREWVGRHHVSAFDLRPNEQVLDSPCGDGFWTSVLTELGFRACGIDLSPKGVEVARERYPGIEFHVGDAEQDLPVEPGSFDIVFSRGITHLHRPELITENSTHMARNLMRYVRPGGLLLVCYYTKRDGDRRPRHAQHPVSELVRLFETAGDPFKVEVVDDYVVIGVQHHEAPRLQAYPSAVKLSARWHARGWLLRLQAGLRRRLRTRAR